MYNTAEFVCEKNNIKYNWRDNIIYILFYTTKLYLEMYMTTVLIFFLYNHFNMSVVPISFYDMVYRILII